jgi:CheY-like chemotaxis protein
MDFILNHPVSLEESLNCEFKEILPSHNPIQEISRIADEYVVSFLNESGGSIYWGIRDKDRMVTGVKLDYSTRDELHKVVGEKIAAIAPSIPPQSYKLPLHPVLSDSNQRNPLKDVFVVEIEVRAPEESTLFLTGTGEAFKKTLGGKHKLSGAQLLNELEKQLHKKTELANNNGQDRDASLAWMPSVANRARVVRPLLQGARILWVDDNPGSTFYERRFLMTLGVQIDQATSTLEAVEFSKDFTYNLVLSDMERNGDSTAGIKLLTKIKQLNQYQPIIFYIGRVDRRKGTPNGAFAITSRPEELLHFVLDVLERPIYSA